MRKVILDLTVPNSREKLHSYLKEKLDLPFYYGNNLDALYDCLTRETSPLFVLIRAPYADEIDEELYMYMEKVIRVFADAEGANKNLGSFCI